METGKWVDGVICDLKTGPLRERHPNATHTACTIEMANLDIEYDVVVVDEI